MKRELWLTAIALIFVLSSSSFSQSASEAESLSLTMKLQSAYNPGFTLCMPIGTDNELTFSWTRDIVRSSFSALVSKPKDGLYHLRFELKEGVLDNIAYDVKAEPDLKSDTPYELTFTKTSGFELGYHHILILSPTRCK